MISDFLYTMIFLFFIVYFHIKSKEKINENLSKNVTCQDFAVEVEGLPPEPIQIAEVENFFSKFGEVKNVYLSRKYNGVLSSYKERANYIAKEEFYKALLESGKKVEKKLIQIQKKIREFDQKFTKVEPKTHDELPVDRGFVLFNQVSDRAKCLREFKRANSCCVRYKQELKFQNKYKLKVSQTSDPSNINWENLDYSPCKRLLRQSFSYFVAGGIIVVSIVIFYLLKNVDSELPDKNYCMINFATDPNLSLASAKETYTTNKAIICYCKALPINNILSDSNYRSFCSYYIEQKTYNTLIRVSVSLSVVALNFVLKHIFRYLGRFERIVSVTYQQLKVMTKVFITTFINTSLVVLAVNADFNSLEFVKYLPFNDTIFGVGDTDFSRS